MEMVDVSQRRALAKAQQAQHDRKAFRRAHSIIQSFAILGTLFAIAQVVLTAFGAEPQTWGVMFSACTAIVWAVVYFMGQSTAKHQQDQITTQKIHIAVLERENTHLYSHWTDGPTGVRLSDTNGRDETEADSGIESENPERQL